MAASWMAAPWVTASWMAASNLDYFADFEQVKNLIVILLTLNKLKKKLPWEKLDAYASLFYFFCHCLMSTALHPGFSDL